MTDTTTDTAPADGAAQRPRICPECGSDTYKAGDYDRIADRLARVSEQIRQSFARAGVAEANRLLAEIEADIARRSLQRKVHKQRQVINRLENKLLKLRSQPYAPTPAAPAPANGAAAAPAQRAKRAKARVK